MSEALKIWHDGEDLIIAASAERAAAILPTIYGDLEDLHTAEDFDEWPAGKPITIHSDETGEDETRLPAEWIAVWGNVECHLASANW